MVDAVTQIELAEEIVVGLRHRAESLVALHLLDVGLNQGLHAVQFLVELVLFGYGEVQCFVEALGGRSDSGCSRP